MELGKGSFLGINNFVKLCRDQQIIEDFDVLVGVSGFKGFGKSTFSVQVSRRYVRKYLDRPYKLEDYTAYTIEDVFSKLDTLPEFSPISADEAVNFALGEDWMRRNMKKLKKIFARVRTKHHIFFFNIPDIWWLDKKYRENMMTMWIHIVKKGHVMLALPNIAPAIEDRWYRSWLQKRFTKNIVNIFTPIEYIMRKLKRYPCYFDQFSFPKMPEPMYQKHLKLREKYMLQREVTEETFREKLILYLYWKFVLENNGGKHISFNEFTSKFLWNPLRDRPIMHYDNARRWIREVEKTLEK